MFAKLLSIAKTCAGKRVLLSINAVIAMWASSLMGY
jgi:hypothetical protein